MGDWVYLKMQFYRQLSMKSRRRFKFSPKFYGPFEILQKVGLVDCPLKLPTGTIIHNVFHVSFLKKNVGNA